MSRLKLMTIIGTRPEIIRLSVVIKSVTATLIRSLSTPARTMTTSSIRCSLMTWVFGRRTSIWMP